MKKNITGHAGCMSTEPNDWYNLGWLTIKQTTDYDGYITMKPF